MLEFPKVEVAGSSPAPRSRNRVQPAHKRSKSGVFHVPSALPQKFADRNEALASAKNPTEREVGEAVQRASRHDLTCHIEQKNWAVVRRLVGYDRLEWPALAALERIHDLAGDYINFLHPVRKLVSKTRSGPRVTRRYDLASTPFHRLLDSGALFIKMTNELKKRSQNIDPYRLKVQLESAQRTLAVRAAQSDPYIRQP
jgi:hypothetical protein